MKNTHDNNIKLLNTLIDLMNKKKITDLKYETSELKIKIGKDNKSSNKRVSNIDEIIKDNTKPEKKENKTFTSDSPGAVKSPMVGTAYTSPEPGKPPFVRVGDNISKGQPLVIIEAMKVMNTINAEISGKIVYIGFEDGQPVEFDQLLVVIE